MIDFSNLLVDGIPLIMVVFGLAFSGEVRHARVMVVNHDRAVLSPSRGRPAMSKEILACIDREVLDIVEVASEAEAVAEVEAGRAAAVMILKTLAAGKRLSMQGLREASARSWPTMARTRPLCESITTMPT
mgnify:CR=1 FL=1